MITQRIELTLRMPDGTLATVGVDVTNTPADAFTVATPEAICTVIAGFRLEKFLQRWLCAELLHQRGPFVVPTDEPASTPGEGRVSP